MQSGKNTLKFLPYNTNYSSTGDSMKNNIIELNKPINFLWKKPLIFAASEKGFILSVWGSL